MAGPKFNILLDKVKYKYDNGLDGGFNISDDSDLTNFVISLALGFGVMIPAGPGVMDIGMGYNTALTKFDSTMDLYNFGVDIQIGYRFKL